MEWLIGVILNDFFKNAKFQNRCLHNRIDPQRNSASNALNGAPRSLFWTRFVKKSFFA